MFSLRLLLYTVFASILGLSVQQMQAFTHFLCKDPFSIAYHLSVFQIPICKFVHILPFSRLMLIDYFQCTFSIFPSLFFCFFTSHLKIASYATNDTLPGLAIVFTMHYFCYQYYYQHTEKSSK